jgi:hypothetical protein
LSSTSSTNRDRKAITTASRSASPGVSWMLSAAAMAEQRG